MCKPILPLVEDELAHIFWKAEHLATVHQHYGNHHAEEEIATATQEEDKDKNPASSKTCEPVSIHLIVHLSFSIPQFFIEKTKFGTRIYNASSLSLGKLYPPPRFC